MAISRSEVRQLILKIKASEDWQKRCKEQLMSLLRTEQFHPNSNVRVKSESTSITKRFIVQLKNTNELNKLSRSILREILINKQNFEVSEKTSLSRNQTQPLGFQPSYHDGKQMNTLPFESRAYIRKQEVQAKNFGNSVQKTSLTKSTELTRRNVLVTFENMINSGTGKFTNKKFSRVLKGNFAKTIYTSMFICILMSFREIPEFKKIRCKIK